ncbi:anti-virulence regulator CigR family protein [Halomonas beimenensis]|uniref:Periplasmic regulator RcnB of Ni and Co efflux n=1 Tax=Halomonas beimenensis TaxID=475662 RepID=A0A291P7Y0_9GAMM|nr:anti-virulence regulator CigR family protein [Halomonas beimenensis]ATJ82995.1 periplasmic regulator RcnB of Ni and Co efflux [Halomonas beimenensis]
MRSRRRYRLVTALSLLLAASPVVASPGNGQPPGHAKAAGGQAERGHDETPPARHVEEPSIEATLIREVFRRHRDTLAIDDRERLPPGIRMNLARGKPLPPGIAKRLDTDILRDLPHHEGYEWRRVGWDVVLVDATHDIIHAVIRDVLN